MIPLNLFKSLLCNTSLELFAISVMLQPFDYDPQEKNKHKFMVQTMFAPDGPIESQEQLVSVSKIITNYIKSTFCLILDTY